MYQQKAYQPEDKTLFSRWKQNLSTVGSLYCTMAVFCSAAATAGFLEMPDTTEVPEFERESMLLDMDIPPVRERDPDPQAGPRLNVKDIRIQGLIEYPALGITRETIIQQVEADRLDMMHQGNE